MIKNLQSTKISPTENIYTHKLKQKVAKIYKLTLIVLSRDPETICLLSALKATESTSCNTKIVHSVSSWLCAPTDDFRKATERANTIDQRKQDISHSPCLSGDRFEITIWIRYSCRRQVWTTWVLLKHKVGLRIETNWSIDKTWNQSLKCFY